MKDLWRLFRLFLPYWKRITAGILVSLITFLADLGLLALSGWFIFAMAIAGISGSSINYFTPAAAIRAFAICRTVGRYAERLITHDNALRLLSTMRVWLYERLEPLAPARLQEFRSGDLLSRLDADISVLDNFYVRLLTPLLAAIFGIGLCTLFLSWYNLSVALVTLIFLLFAGGVVPALVRHVGARTGEEMVDASSRLRTQVIDGLQGMGELRVFGASEGQARSIEETTGELLGYQARMSRLKGLSDGAVGLFANLALWSSLVLLIPLVHRGELAGLDLPMLGLFVLASFEVVAPLPIAFQMLGKTLTAARRVFAVVDTEPMVHEPISPSPPPEKFTIKFRDLSFRYRPELPRALTNINLQIPAGRRTAVIGATGSGKSTLINVLLRFWDYTEGEILFGGLPLKSYRLEDVRRFVAVVSQDTHLFNTTIRENILLANLNANEQQMFDAAKAAQIHDFILSLPDGYHTFVGEAGIRLSVGQCRRVAIARALLKEAPILILDEPTEGLDAETEKQLMEALLELMAGRSVLLITHRLVGLQVMDEVVLLDSGKIVERGSHADLMLGSARYRRYHDLLDRVVSP